MEKDMATRINPDMKDSDLIEMLTITSETTASGLPDEMVERLMGQAARALKERNAELAALKETLAMNFPQFENADDVTPEAISILSADFAPVVQTEIMQSASFVNRLGQRVALEWDEGDPDAGVMPGYIEVRGSE